MGTTAHLAQTGVVQMNAIKAARLGLGTVTHFYGHFESLLKDNVVQPYPVTHNYNNEQDRFGQVARLWDKIHPPGSPEWKAYLEEHLKLGTTFDPTLTIYSAGRDVMRFRAAEWHDKFTLPSLMEFYTPDRNNHGAYWYDWTTEDEVAFRNFYQVWFKLMNDYKKMGGRVVTGSDSGFIYQTYGFGFINELELLQEAGFHPLEADPVGDDERRGDAVRAAAQQMTSPRDRRGPRGHARRHGDRRSEPAAELQGAVRERHHPVERQDRPGRARRRHQVDDQGRHRLRREEARGGRDGDGREAEARTKRQNDNGRSQPRLDGREGRGLVMQTCDLLEVVMRRSRLSCHRRCDALARINHRRSRRVPRSSTVEKVKDNLFVLKGEGGGGNVAVYVGARA